MSIQSQQLKERTMTFSVSVLGLINRFPRTPAGDVLARQLAKSSTSIAANYRAACSGRSRRDFLYKLGIVVEEAEESVYWLDLVVRLTRAAPSSRSSHAWMIDGSTITPIRQEAGELLAIFARSLGTARFNSQNV